MTIKRLIVDAGHGGEALGFYVTPGKRSPEPPPKGIYEGVFNRWFAKRFCKIAKKEGYETVNLVGDSVVDIGLKNRCQTEKLFANKESLFISFHVNAIGDVWQNTATGSRILYKSQVGKKYADSISKYSFSKTEKATLWKSFSISRNNLYVLKKTKSPAVLIELGFMDNKNDLKFLKNKTDLIIKRILKGIANA